MKFFPAGVAICLLCQAAVAQTPDCKSSRAVPVLKTDGDGAKYVDSIGAEEARVNARLKNICRGC